MYFPYFLCTGFFEIGSPNNLLDFGVSEFVRTKICIYFLVFVSVSVYIYEGGNFNIGCSFVLVKLVVSTVIIRGWNCEICPRATMGSFTKISTLAKFFMCLATTIRRIVWMRVFIGTFLIIELFFDGLFDVFKCIMY